MTNPTKIGRYEIIERVGRGGMGVLYRGRDGVLDREVAIKVMSTDFAADDDTARPRFYREARAAAKLQHRNIVTIFEFGEEDHTPFIVMEFLRGQDLAKRMRSDPPLGLEEKLDIVADLCTGLHFAHEQGVIHRDVKPANIWIQPDGSIKLLDFGIAKFASSTMTRQGSVLGSVSYMAPEQVTGREVDGRADVFSAGVVLFELLTGRKPFDGDSPTAVLARIIDDQPAPIDRIGPDVPKPLVAALAKALQKDRDLRYRHAADFGADLRLVRSAVSAVDPMTLDIEMTRGMIASTSTGSTIIPTPGISADPAGAATLRHEQTPAPAPTPARPTPAGRWLIPSLAAAVILIAVAFFAWRGATGGTPAPTGPKERVPTGAGPAEPARPVTTETKAEPQGRGSRQPAAERAADASRQVMRSESRGASPEEGPAVSAPSGTDVVLSGSYPFEVYLEGRLLSSEATEHRVRVSGRQTLKVSAPEYFLDAAYVVDAGRHHVAVPELGRLKLRFPEGCAVVIGRRTLTEPPNTELPIAAGSYRILMSCTDESARNYSVTIRPGDVSQAFITK